MVDAKHTPGPWRTYSARGSDGEHCYWGIDPEGDYRGTIGSSHDAEHIGGITKEESEANARLIAAAPELLEALDEMTAICAACTFENIYIRGQYFNREGSVERARAAIAKAKGEGK